MFSNLKLKGLLICALCCMNAPVFADVFPRTEYIYRLRRVGYEVLNDGTRSAGMTIWDHLCVNRGWIVLSACCVICICLVLFVKKWRLCVCRFILRCAEILRVKPAELIILVVFMLAALGAVAYLTLEQIRLYKVYVSDSGWKYSDQVSRLERWKLMRDVASVQTDLQKAVDASNKHYMVRSGEWHSNERRKQEALLEVISESTELRNRCWGIPIEYLSDKIRVEASPGPEQVTHQRKSALHLDAADLGQ